MTPSPAVLRLAPLTLLLVSCLEPLVRVSDDGPGGGAGGGGGGLSCGTNLTVCANVCVDTRYDDENCGGCGITCAADQSCAAGTCYSDDCGSADCSPDQVCFNERCTGKECVGVLCPATKACYRGVCEGPECNGSTCPQPQVCLTNMCADPNCIGVLCPTGLSCVAGECLNACTPGGSCTPSEPCRLGSASCDPQRCDAAGPTPPGSSCGSGLVCDGDAGCVVCSAGAPCAQGACLAGVINCISGGPVCGALAPLPFGQGCPGGACDGDGGCALCVGGSACAPSDPCRSGVTACFDGGAVCNAGAQRDAGASCGTNAVCAPDAGCIACTAGAACSPPNTCMQGQVSCAGGVPSCVTGAPAMAGLVCDGGVCDGDGGCGPCTAGVACGTGKACERGIISCTSGPQCVPSGAKTMGTPCRSAVDACDVADSCDGVTLTCPTDAKSDAGVPCGSPDTTDCNAADTCDGLGVCVNRFKPSSAMCRGAGPNAVCDPAEFCTSTGPTCPGDFKPGTTVACGSADNTLCNAPDTCDGNGACVDRLKPSTATCRATGAGNNAICDPAELCTGSDAGCANDFQRPNGYSCGTNLVCRNGTTCNACTQGAFCNPGGDTCLNGSTACGTGVPVCNYVGPAGQFTACGTGQYCSGDGVCCDPRWPFQGSTHSGVQQGGFGQWQFHNVWCTAAPNTCVQGKVTVSQTLMSQSCYAWGTGDAGCEDADATWIVICSSTVTCSYQCDGSCLDDTCT